NDFAIRMPWIIPHNPLDASYTFDTRASALLRFAGCRANDSTYRGVFNSDFSDNLEGWGRDALAKLAYAGLCTGSPSEVTERYRAVDLRLSQLSIPSDLRLGTSIGKTTYGPVAVERKGELDTGLKELIPIAYLYKDKLPMSYAHLLDVLARAVADNGLIIGSPPTFIVDVGKVDTGIGVVGHVNTPETENHTLLELSEQYLVNQLLNREYAQSCNSTVAGCLYPPGTSKLWTNMQVHDYLMKDLRGILTSDFFEYNSKPYQHYALYAMENLADFAEDADVATASRMVLDFEAAKFAASSSLLRRSSPYRRRGSHEGHFLTGSYEDEQTCRFYLYSGQLQAAYSNGTYNANGGCISALREAIGTYRVPTPILSIAIDKSMPYLQTFSGGPSYFAGLFRREDVNFGHPVYGPVEIYDNEGPFLIAAGGIPQANGLPAYLSGSLVDIGAWAQSAWPYTSPDKTSGPSPTIRYSVDEEDTGISLPTILIPYDASGNPTAMQPAVDRAQFIQIRCIGHHDLNLCVAPNFACGKNPTMPKGLAGNFIAGSWKFGILPSQPVKTYVAMLTISPNLVYHRDGILAFSQAGPLLAVAAPYQIGLFEAEPENKFPNYTAFRQSVMRSNPRGADLILEQRYSVVAQPDNSYASEFAHELCIPWRQKGTCDVVMGWAGDYTTTDGAVLHFNIPASTEGFTPVLYPISGSDTRLPNTYFGTWNLADGPIQSNHTGLTVITSPVDGTSCRLDITDIHNPQRSCGGPKYSPTHSGFMIQSTYGKQGNFEIVIPKGERLVHYWRDNDAAGFPDWRDNDAAGFPWHAGSEIKGVSNKSGITAETVKGATLLQSTFGGNLEVLAWLHTTRSEVMGTDGSKVASDYLVHYVRDATTMKWSGPGLVVADGKLIEGVTATPAFIQSTVGRQGNFEMVVPQGERLVHYWRDNDAAGFPWHAGSEIKGASNKSGTTAETVKGATLLQSTFGGNLEVLAWLHTTRSEVMGTDGSKVPLDYLVHYVFDRGINRWKGPDVLTPEGKIATGVSGPL